MKLAKTILVSATVVNIYVAAAFAQETTAGMITGINRLNGTIAIKPIQHGTVGSSAGDAAEEFKVQDGGMLDGVHAGDRVIFSLSAQGGAKTITKLERQK